MPKKILFENCKECPIGENGSFGGKSVSCIETGGTYNGHKMYRIILDGTHKPKECPYPAGIVVRACDECPYVVEDWGKCACPKIRPRSLVGVKCGEIDKDCPLEGIDCDKP